MCGSERVRENHGSLGPYVIRVHPISIIIVRASVLVVVHARTSRSRIPIPNCPHPSLLLASALALPPSPCCRLQLRGRLLLDDHLADAGHRLDGARPPPKPRGLLLLRHGSGLG